MLYHTIFQTREPFIIAWGNKHGAAVQAWKSWSKLQILTVNNYNELKYQKDVRKEMSDTGRVCESIAYDCLNVPRNGNQHENHQKTPEVFWHEPP